MTTFNSQKLLLIAISAIWYTESDYTTEEDEEEEEETDDLDSDSSEG